MLNAAILIQARMSSKRCPGKVLANLNGAPLLKRLLESLEKNRHRLNIIVCTSHEASDDPVEQFCLQHQTKYFRGPLNDVAQRFISAAEHFKLEHLVRISGDSPWLNVDLIDKVVQRYTTTQADLCCNLYPRTFPKGQSLEMFSLNSLQKYYSLMNESDKEHVTPIFYRNAEVFNIENIAYSSSCHHLDLSVDTPAQLTQCQEIFNSLEKPHWDYDIDELLKLYRLI